MRKYVGCCKNYNNTHGMSDITGGVRSSGYAFKVRWWDDTEN
jgi:hypothetical protein